MFIYFHVIERWSNKERQKRGGRKEDGAEKRKRKRERRWERGESSFIHWFVLQMLTIAKDGVLPKSDFS